MIPPTSTFPRTARRIASASLLALVTGTVIAQAPLPQPKVVFKGHTETVYAAAISADGKIAATGSFDKSVKVWDPATGKDIRQLAGKNGHTNQILSLAFSPDGAVLASGGSDNSAKLWDVKTAPKAGETDPTPTKSLAHPNLVDAVAFDKTGTQLATACHDGILRIWDVAKGTATKTINAHTLPVVSPIYTVAWSPDAKLLATGSYDHSIKFWDAAAGTLIREIQPGTDRQPPDPKFAPFAGALIGSLGSGWLNAPPSRGHRDQVFSVSFDKTGKYLVSGSSDRTVKVWDVATGDLVREFANPKLKSPAVGFPTPSHPGFVHTVRFLPDGTKVLSAGSAPRGQGYLAIWSVADGKLLSGFDLPYGPVYAAELAPDGSVLLGCGPKDRTHPEADAILLPLPK